MINLTQYQKSLIREDFEHWGGGWAPESSYECRVYVDYAIEAECDPEIAYSWLIQQIGEWE